MQVIDTSELTSMLVENVSGPIGENELRNDEIDNSSRTEAPTTPAEGQTIQTHLKNYVRPWLYHQAGNLHLGKRSGSGDFARGPVIVWRL